MNKLTRAILVGIGTALFAVLVLVATLLFERPLLDNLSFGAAFLVIMLDPRVETFYLYGNAFRTIAVCAIGWFLVGAVIGFFKKIKYIISAWIVAYVIASIISFMLLL